MKTGWTIGKKLIVSFVAVSVITLTLGIVGYYGAVKSEQAVNELGNVTLPSVQKLVTIMEQAGQIKAAMRTLLNPEASATDRKRQPETIAKATQDLEEAKKAYETLPQTPEEAALWKEFLDAWKLALVDRDEFFKINSELESLDILNPTALQRDLQKFQFDHYKLTVNILSLLETGTEFKGGDDPTTCNYGKWVAQFKSTNPELKRVVDATHDSHAAFHAAVKKVVEIATQGNKDGGVKMVYGEMKIARDKTFEGFDALLTEVTKAGELYKKLDQQGMIVCRASDNKALALLDNIVKLSEENATNTVTASIENAAFLEILCLAAMIVGVVAALALGILISRGINNTLRRIIEGLSAGANQVESASTQISQSSQQLAEGATEQASSLEESSSALEELASQARNNAESAEKAMELMNTAKKVIGETGHAMEQMVQTMSGIKESSGKISGIIKTIEEIAFQTNLLALNAAVEAARAGEHGKGFAVVAEEVRNLAQRSAVAARDTANLIQANVEQSNRGAEVVQKAAAGIKNTAENATQVAQFMETIDTASHEQAQGIDQINIAVAQMDKVTQQVAANAEESASASEELASQSHLLTSIVGELATMVGGAVTQGAGRPTPTVALHGEHQGVPRKTKTLVPAPRLTHTQTDTSRKSKAAAAIPFDEDFTNESMKDF